MTGERVLVVGDTPKARLTPAEAVFQAAGYAVRFVADGPTGLAQARAWSPAVIVACQGPDQSAGLDMLALLCDEPLAPPVILIAAESTEWLAIQALRLGAQDYLAAPVTDDDLLDAIDRVCAGQVRRDDQPAGSATTHQLEEQLRELNTLVDIGKRITSGLDLHVVITRVVEAAVELALAEEGTLMLVDQATNKLYLYASIGAIRQVEPSFRLPVADSLAGQVVRTGKPLVITGEALRKIKTHYMFRDIAYVPLLWQGKVTGVLGISNREQSAPFTPHTLQLLSVLADFAAIAIENARLYASTLRECNTLNAIMRDTEDAIIVVDSDDHILYTNPVACQDFGIDTKTAVGHPLHDAVGHPGVVSLFAKAGHSPQGYRGEITLDNGERILSVRIIPIEGVGRVLITQDVTHIKDLNRAKIDFVTTVSHDLRSPLTTILGYVELINRSGPLNDIQQQFIQRIVTSVQSITALITDLLELGKIEDGYEHNFEPVALDTIVADAVEGMRQQWESKRQALQITASNGLPMVEGNPLRLRQLVNNLLENAIKYTSDGGDIHIGLETNSQFVLLTVADSGIGIPPEDQPYIFDKFYRTDEAIDHYAGTGLGLSIVQGIVNQHRGRIWVDSRVGEGTTFTVMLPALTEE